MSQKFLSDVTLSTVTGGSMLKLDANGKIVAAVDGTDYISTSASSLWSIASGGIFYSDDVRVGTYQSDVAPDAKLHVYDYQTTTPKLLIEDGNTGDASMEFKISTQSFTMGIDNSDSDKFVIAASGGLGTSNVLEIATSGLSAFQNSVLVKGNLFINNQEQIQQGATEKIASFQNLGTERGYFEVTDTAKGYFVADGFKTATASTGFLKADGSVDTGSFFSGAYSDLTGKPTLGTMAAANTNDYKTSDEVETYVAGELVYTNISGTPTLGTAAAANTTDFATAAQGALADSALQSLPSHNHDGRYYTETEADNKFAQNGNNLVPINATDSHYQLFTEEVILATVNTYRGLAFPNGGKNFVFEVSIKGTNGANHQGIFWGLDTLETIYNNGEAGYKLTHQAEGAFHIRDIASNANQATSQDVMYAPNDGLYHRYKIISYVDPSNSNKAFFKVYVDGNLIFNAPQFAAPPQTPTYFGFINYTGEATFSNWNVREITGEAELALLYGDGVFQPAGNYLTSLPAHHHDARYYTETEMDTFLAGKLSTSGGVLSGALNVLYTDSPTGTGWDKNLFIGTSDDLGLAGAFPTYVPSGSYGFFSHANSDGVFIGSVPTAAGSSNYYATIAWGDDSTEYLQFLYKGTQVAYLETDGDFYIDGSFYSGTSKIATETFASGEAQAVQDNLDTVVGSLGSNAYTSYTDHTGLYDTVGSAAAEAGAVQDNLDSLAGSLGTAAYTASTDYAAASHTHSQYLTSVPAEYLTQTEGDARYYRPSANALVLGAKGDDIGGSRGYVSGGGGDSSLEAILANVALNFESASDEPSTIYFKSGVNAPSDFAYISFLPNKAGVSEEAVLQIGVENDGAGSSDYIRLQGRVSTVVDYVSSEATVIQDWVYQGTQKAYIDTSGNLQLDGGITANGYNKSNWDTAFGWGNHAGLYDAAGSAEAVQTWVNEQNFATDAAISTAIGNLIDSAPTALNTLNELAAALGDDANFSTTVTNNIGAIDTRINDEVMPYIGDVETTANAALPKAGGTMTGDLQWDTSAATTNTHAKITFGQSPNPDGSLNGLAQVANYGADGYGLLLHVGYGESDNGGIKITDDGVIVWGASDENVFTVIDEDSRTERFRIDNSGNITASGTLTASGYNKSNWDTAYGWGNHAGLYDAAGSAAAVNERIDTEVFDAIGNVAGSIPTNNNQLTNGAGYITSYSETDTIDSVADRGNTTNQTIVSNNALGFRVDSSSAARIEIESNDSWSYLRLRDNSNVSWDIACFNDGQLEWRRRGIESNRMTLSTSGDLTVNGNINAASGHSVYAFGGTGKNIRMYVNDSWAYLTTNVGKYYLNAEVRVDGGKIGSYNEPLELATSGTTRVVIEDSIGHMFPVTDRAQWLGLDTNRWQIVFCEILDSAGQHEKNLQNPEGEKSVGEYETGTVLVWKGGKNVPCTTAADHMRMGIAVKGIDSPLIQGAEPVLVTGAVNEGDYLVTSSKKEGHAEAISPEFMRQHNLFDCVLGKALESAEGESHLVKTWINI